MNRFFFRKKLVQSSRRLSQLPPPSPIVKSIAKKVQATILYACLREPERWLESMDTEEAVKILDQFYEISKNLILFYGGKKYSNWNHSLLGVWESESNETHSPENTWRAVRSALQVRETLSKINLHRYEKGQHPILYALGVHQGGALSYAQGLIGNGVQGAKRLSQMAVQTRTDLVISQECRQILGTAFEVQALGEMSLPSSLSDSWTTYYGISGYRDESGVLISVPPYPSNSWDGLRERVVLKTENNKWIVRHGGQKIGPLSEQEIADLLFAQSLDFNCECWVPSIDQVTSLQEAGIFKNLVENPNFPGAPVLWVYDTQTVSGPMTLEILKTATQMGILLESNYVCEQSTEKGWVLLKDYLAQKALTVEEASPLSLLQHDQEKWKKVA